MWKGSSSFLCLGSCDQTNFTSAGVGVSAWGNALIWMFFFVCAPLQCCLPGWILWCRHLCKYSWTCMPSLFPPGVILFTSLLCLSLLGFLSLRVRVQRLRTEGLLLTTPVEWGAHAPFYISESVQNTTPAQKKKKKDVLPPRSDSSISSRKDSLSRFHYGLCIFCIVLRMTAVVTSSRGLKDIFMADVLEVFLSIHVVVWHYSSKHISFPRPHLSLSLHWWF